MNDRPIDPAARTLAFASSVLVLVGLLTGGLVAKAMVGKVDADAHAVLAAHLNALLGAFWMLGVAWTMPMLRFGDVGKMRLAYLLIGANFGNWLVTLVKSFLKVAGVDWMGQPLNDGVFAVLGVVVVTPSLVAAAGWVWGFMKKAPEASVSAKVDLG